MRLVNHDHANLHLQHSRLPVSILQPFRRDEQHFDLISHRQRQRSPVLFSRKIRTDDGSRNVIHIVAALALVAHQRLQR